MSDYILQITPEPEFINNKPLYFGCIIKNNAIDSSSNYGFGWSISAATAFGDAYNYYKQFILYNG